MNLALNTSPYRKDLEKQRIIVENEKNYRKNDALNFSAIKDFDEHGPLAYYKKYVAKEKPESTPTDAFDIGNLVDCLLTVPDTFDDRFFVISPDNSLTGQSKELVDEMFLITKKYYNQETGETEVSFEEIFRTAFDNVQIDKRTGEHIKFKGKNWETVLSSFSGGPMEDYYDRLCENISKRGVTHSNYTIAESIVRSLLEVPAINNVFNPSDSDVEVQTQYPLYFEYMGVKLKGLLDVVHINHATKTVKEFDLKTSWTVLDFQYNRNTNRYYLQEAVYNAGLKAAFPDYTINPRTYIIADSKNQIRPYLARTLVDHLDQGYNGFTTQSGYRRRGINEIITEIQWHFDHSVWNTTSEIYKNNDEIVLSLFGN